MKIIRILSIAGAVALLTCGGAAFAQTQHIPVGAGAGVTRQPPGSRFRNPTNRPPAAARPSTAGAGQRAISRSCSQQADAKGLHGKARKAFRNKCVQRGGR